jgi:DNA-binding transcriptional MocR family regulator
VASFLELVEQDYRDIVARGLALDLTRGKPSPEQLDLSAALLTSPGAGDVTADDLDSRNYGGLSGLTELRETFAEFFQVPAAQLLALGNSSLTVMHDVIVQALLSRIPGAAGRWIDEPEIAFLCPVPGYDRHFAICERFGIRMIPVAMTPEGPDMDVVAKLVTGDPSVKGIWCVPKYSNPDGTCYSDGTIQRLASMPTAAPDFRIFWDNAYAVHHLTDEEVEIADLLAACATAGNPDRALVFGSTSKITFAGAGVAFFGGSPDNVAWYLGNLSKQMICPDKVNQLRHARLLKDPDHVRMHMRRHRELLQPKFELVERILTEDLGGTGLASWSKPRGGYFVSLELPDGTAREVVRLAGSAGVALTPAGATHPHADDPRDRTIRIAPSFPGLGELEAAMRVLTTCVGLAGSRIALD